MDHWEEIVEGIYVATVHKNLSLELGGALAAAVQSRLLHCFYVEVSFSVEKG